MEGLSLVRSPAFRDIDEFYKSQSQEELVKTIEYHFDHKLSKSEIRTAETAFNSTFVRQQKIADVWTVVMSYNG